jgi:putative ABC transport system permease protein
MAILNRLHAGAISFIDKLGGQDPPTFEAWFLERDPDMSLALSTLLYEWRRYLAAAISLALAGVLMLALSSFMIGMLSTLTVTIDRSRAEIVVMQADSVSLGPGGGGSLPRRVLPLIYQHPDVVEVQDMPGSSGMFYGPGATEPNFVQVMIIDTAPNAITLPNDFSDDTAAKLSAPFNIAVDKSALAQLKVKLGDKASLSGRTVRVAAVVEGYTSLMGMANIAMSRQTARLMGMVNDSQLGSLMVRIKNPLDAERVRNELNALSNDQYRAWTKQELHDSIVEGMNSAGPIFVAVMFLTIIGAVIGVVITYQTLRGAILANIKEFASLRALGVSIGSLRKVVMELSLWVGLFGVCLSGALMAGLSAIAAANGVTLGFEVPMLVQTGIFLLMIAIVSGALTLGALKKGDPADLLK